MKWGKGFIIQLHQNYDIPHIALYKDPDGTEQIDDIHYLQNVYPSENYPDGEILATIEFDCLNFNVVFVEETDQCIGVFVRSNKAVAWFRKSDIEKIGWKFIYYLDVLDPCSDTLLYSPKSYPLTALNLRTGPGTNFPIITKLTRFEKKDNNPVFEIESLGVRSGNWLKVRVRQFDQAACLDSMPDPVLLTTYEGWIKAIDDGGPPNIWFDFCCEFL